MKDYSIEMQEYLERLLPICRSITGDGNRETLEILREIIPLKVKEYPTSKKVYDWEIPQEWNIKEAWVKDSQGNKIIDFKNSNLHIVGYSVPISKNLKFKELKKHLHYKECLPDAIPYRTSYYQKDWGFCLSYNDFQKYFNDEYDEYEVYINSSFKDGSLSIGELLVPGFSKKEFLIYSYICHPSMANDSLSGVIVAAFLARELLKMKPYYSYRIVWVPETIGAIAYAFHNEQKMKSIDAGFVITTCGGDDIFSYKQSRDQNHYINQFVENAFKNSGLGFKTYPFDIRGSDERQYSSLGFKINMTSIFRGKYYEYDYYHTSLDNLKYVTGKNLQSSLSLYLETIIILEKQIFYSSHEFHCETMLSKHGAYPVFGGEQVFSDSGRSYSETDLILWLLFYCDGNLPLSKIAKDINVDFDKLLQVAEKLVNKSILNRL